MSTRWRPHYSAIDPRQPTQKWTVGVNPNHFESIRRHGSKKKFAQLVQVRDVLEECTELIFEGWSRPSRADNCFVYVGVPKEAHITDTITVSGSHAGFVFLVFVASDGTVVDWGWRPKAFSNGDDLTPLDITGDPIWTRDQS